MKLLAILCPLFIIPLLFVRAANADPEYKVTVLGEFGVSGMNDRAMVVGSSYDVPQRALVWSGTVATLGNGMMSPNYASDINNHNQIVGVGIPGFLFTPAINNPGGAGGSYIPLPGDATGINDSGTVIGSVDNSWEPYAYTSAGITLFPSFSSGEGAGAISINEAGFITGYSDTDTFSTEAGCFNCTTQNYNSNALGSFGMAMNNFGIMVGDFIASDSPWIGRAALWTAPGTMQDLGTLPGDMHSGASAINDNGEVVGASNSAGGESRAFYYNGGGLVDLNTKIDQSLGISLEYANAINKCGQIAAGGLEGAIEKAFLLSPKHSALIFNPDPLTSSGDEAIEDSAEYTFETNAQRECVFLKRLNDIQSLEGTYVSSVNSEVRAVEPSNAFVYSTREPQFRETMVYHYADEAADYVRNTLGIPGLRTDKLYFTNEEAVGGDRYNNEIDLLIFPSTKRGAWDAEAIWHEVIHTVEADLNLSYARINDREVRAIGEGTADYIAVSRFNGVNNGQVAQWAIPSSDTRFVNENSVRIWEPSNNYYAMQDPHLLGQLWSGILWEIRELPNVGRLRCDILALETYRLLKKNNGLETAARRLLPLTHIYGIANESAVKGILISHGLIKVPTALSLDVPNIQGGQSTFGTVTLSTKAVDPVTVYLVSDNSAVSVPSSIVISTGSISQNFSISTTAVSSNTTAEISAMTIDADIQTHLTLIPAPTKRGNRPSTAKVDIQVAYQAIQ